MRNYTTKTRFSKFLLISGFAIILLSSGTLPKMQNVQLVDGVSISLPKEMVIMSDDDVATKYPSTKKPVAMYTSLDRTVDFGLNISKSRWSGFDLELLHQVYKSTIIESYDTVIFSKDTVEYINGRPFSVFEFVSTFDKTTKYQYFQFTLLTKTKVEAQEETGDLLPGNSNHIMIFNFTSPLGGKDKWQPIARASMQTVKVNAKKASKAIPEVSQPDVKGLTPKSTLEQQNKKKQTNKK
jgi:hypothetical protein